MPVYEYLCAECRCRFEEYREVRSRSTCRCPKCGNTARKVFRPGGIIFKGPGFHVTDYRKTDGSEKSTATSGVEKTPKAD